MSKPLAQIATRCIHANGYSDRVTVLPKHSKDLVVGVDIPARVDVIVTELVDSGKATHTYTYTYTYTHTHTHTH